MGGRGSKAGTKVVSLPGAARTSGGWHYPGISERLDKLEAALNNTRSTNGINSIARALRAEDKTITKAMRSDAGGDQKVLMSLRRRTRVLMGKARW